MNTQQGKKVYFEHQIEPDTCFRHAINHYFQMDYISLIIKYYKPLVVKYAHSIDEVKLKYCQQTFYGDQEEPDESKLEEKSSPEINEDLFSYYQIYYATTALDLVEQIESSDYKELSCVQVLFLLEFQLAIDEHDKSLFVLKHVPHRFYHRYARSENEQDKFDSTERYIKIIENLSVSTSSFYLCRVQSGKAHAFGALRNFDDNWILMDSLFIALTQECSGNPRDLFLNVDLAGRASVLVTKNERINECLILGGLS